MEITEQQYIADDNMREDIINVTLEDLGRYVKFAQLREGEFEDNGASHVKMHMDDIAYMARVLGEFAVDGDVDTLEDKIMHQDTFPREWYINTLRMLDAVREEMYVPEDED